MSDEEKKGKKPRIGGIGQQRQQYGTIGGGHQRQGGDIQMPESLNVQPSERLYDYESERRDAEMLERRDAAVSETPDVQTFGTQDVLPSEHVNVEALRSLDAQSNVYTAYTADRIRHQLQVPRTSGKNRRRTTAYILEEHYRWIRHRTADTDEEISDLINEALRLLRDKLG